MIVKCYKLDSNALLLRYYTPHLNEYKRWVKCWKLENLENNDLNFERNSSASLIKTKMIGKVFNLNKSHIYFIYFLEMKY